MIQWFDDFVKTKKLIDIFNSNSAIEILKKNYKFYLEGMNYRSLIILI